MPTDRIILTGMQFYGFHGVNPEERRLGQPFVVDLEAEIDLRQAGRSDHLAETVSYAHLYRTARQVMEGEPRQLLEAAAENIAELMLALYSSIDAVRVRVSKPRPPIKGSVIESAAVEIYRER